METFLSSGCDSLINNFFPIFIRFSRPVSGARKRDKYLINVRISCLGWFYVSEGSFWSSLTFNHHPEEVGQQEVVIAGRHEDARDRAKAAEHLLIWKGIEFRINKYANGELERNFIKRAAEFKLISGIPMALLHANAFTVESNLNLWRKFRFQEGRKSGQPAVRLANWQPEGLWLNCINLHRQFEHKVAAIEKIFSVSKEAAQVKDETQKDGKILLLTSKKTVRSHKSIDKM